MSVWMFVGVALRGHPWLRGAFVSGIDRIAEQGQPRRAAPTSADRFPLQLKHVMQAVSRYRLRRQPGNGLLRKPVNQTREPAS